MAVRDLRAARRYATAIFETARREQKLDVVENDLNTVVDLMKQTPIFQQMWESPQVPSGRKRELLSQLLGETVDTLTLSFLRLLVDKRREEILEAVCHDMRQLADASRHLVRAEATFAVEPTPQEHNDLIQSLEKMTGENVQLTTNVNPDILGGVVVRMRDTILDGSVRGTLERLREQLLHEA